MEYDEQVIIFISQFEKYGKTVILFQISFSLIMLERNSIIHWKLF